MTTTTDDLKLPERSTGWKRGTVRLAGQYAGGSTAVSGLVKYGYGVSRGADRDSGHRLTQLKSGLCVARGAQRVMKRIAEALHENVPALEDLEGGDTSSLSPADNKAIKHLQRLARLEG